MTKKIDPHYTETPPPECSDGVDTKYPTNTDSEASPDNYFRLVDKTERKNLLYRLEGARAIVTEFDLITEANKKHAPFVLSDFPENYKLYEHNKKQSVSFALDPGARLKEGQLLTFLSGIYRMASSVLTTTCLAILLARAFAPSRSSCRICCISRPWIFRLSRTLRRTTSTLFVLVSTAPVAVVVVPA